MLKTTITIAGTEYERVTDLHILAAGDRIRQNHENHSTSRMTVLEPYGRHEGGTGVRCRLEGRETYTTVLTQHSADAGPVWRAIA